ncbi:MAG: S-layer homology domain-containing protein [Clostridiales bacterium]|nr:S-layer homology domain-containing protein [Clostridiales bacterium]
MPNKKRINKFLPLLVVMMVVLTFWSVTGLAGSASTTVDPVTITMSFADDTGFYVTPQQYTVTADLAEYYGYSDSAAGVSVLDAIVKLHTLVYGEDKEDINAALEVDEESGFVTSFMGDGRGNVVGLINGALGEDIFGETLLTGGDRLEFFIPQDDWAMDTYAWFESEGQRVEKISVVASEDFELTLSGMAMIVWGDWGAYETAVEGAGIVPVSVEAGGVGADFNVGYFGEPLAVTNEDGIALLHFDEPGTYYVSAIDVDSDAEIPIMAPWCEVTVDYWLGTGAVEDPYLLSTQNDLTRLKTLVDGGKNFTGKYFQLTQDIGLDASWIPIGTSARMFSGRFDGSGHTISFAFDSKPLFGVIGGGGIVQNLSIFGEYISDFGLMSGFVAPSASVAVTIDNVTIKSGTTVKKSGFAGDPGGTVFLVEIKNCTVESGVRIGYDAIKDEPADSGEGYPPTSGARSGPGVGSFVSGLCGTVSNSVSYATVYGQSNVGGIAGYKAQAMRPFTVKNCVFAGEIIATGDYVGGIVGGGYAPLGGGFWNAPNTPGVVVENCYATGSISGNNCVGGIFGGEGHQVQAWSSGIGYIRNNHFFGAVAAKDGEGAYLGGIIGYLNSLDRYNIITNNYYLNSCGTEKGIGGVKTIDTSYAEPTEVIGTTYVKTGSYSRNDDPLGLDAATLARAVTASQMRDGTVKDWLNNGEGSLSNWGQGANYPIHGEDAIAVIELKLSGSYKTSYAVGDIFSTTGMVITAVFSDGSERCLLIDEVSFSGYDKDKTGTQEITVTYDGKALTFNIRVLSSGAGSDSITVYFTLYGDANHTNTDAGGPIHTLKDGGLTTWIATTAYTVPQNATVLDVFETALTAAKLGWNNVGGNYIASITKGDLTLAEFTNGPLSGWMYTLNNDHSELGVAEQSLKRYDRIVFHYTDDYTKEDGSEKWDPPKGGAGSSGTTSEATVITLVQSWLNPFKDVSASDWFYEAVKFVAEKGIMQGTASDLFSGQQALTRAMLVTMLYRHEGEEKVTAVNPFQDVPSDQWYRDAVIWASEKGIVKGYGDGRFGPNDNITREQFALILYNYAKWKELDVNKTASLAAFQDADKVSDWAKTALEWAVGAGLIQGRSEDVLAPKGTATRAEAAMLFMRFMALG